MRPVSLSYRKPLLPECELYFITEGGDCVYRTEVLWRTVAEVLGSLESLSSTLKILRAFHRISWLLFELSSAVPSAEIKD